MKEEWAQKVTVVVHHVAHSEEYEGGYEAVTIMGVPYGVAVTGSDPNSTQGALNRLLEGLRVFGYTGWVSVEDATYFGGVQHYEVEVSG